MEPKLQGTPPLFFLTLPLLSSRAASSKLKRALPEEVSDDLVRLPGMISCQILDALVDALSDNSPSAIS